MGLRTTLAKAKKLVKALLQKDGVKTVKVEGPWDAVPGNGRKHRVLLRFSVGAVDGNGDYIIEAWTIRKGD